MLSRIFGKGSIYETLDLDDRRDDDHPGYGLYNSGLTHDDPQYSGIDPRKLLLLVAIMFWSLLYSAIRGSPENPGVYFTETR